MSLFNRKTGLSLLAGAAALIPALAVLAIPSTAHAALPAACGTPVPITVPGQAVPQCIPEQDTTSSEPIISFTVVGPGNAPFKFTTQTDWVWDEESPPSSPTTCNVAQAFATGNLAANNCSEIVRFWNDTSVNPPQAYAIQFNDFSDPTAVINCVTAAGGPAQLGNFPHVVEPFPEQAGFTRVFSTPITGGQSEMTNLRYQLTDDPQGVTCAMGLTASDQVMALPAAPPAALFGLAALLAATGFFFVRRRGAENEVA